MHARIHFPYSQRRPANTRPWLAFCAAVPLLITLTAGAATAAAAPSAASAGDPSVISDWNAIAVATLSADTTKQPVEDILYTAFVQAAVYNAVVGIGGRYAPYRFHAHAPRGASAQAAAVGAVARLRDATAGAQRHPVRSAGSACAHLGPLHPRLQRGQGSGFAHLDRAHGGPDEHRDVLLRQRTSAVQRRAAGPGDRAAPGYRRRRPDVRSHRHECRGR